MFQEVPTSPEIGQLNVDTARKASKNRNSLEIHSASINEPQCGIVQIERTIGGSKDKDTIFTVGLNLEKQRIDLFFTRRE
jgi:hypothetical protein